MAVLAAVPPLVCGWVYVRVSLRALRESGVSTRRAEGVFRLCGWGFPGVVGLTTLVVLMLPLVTPTHANAFAVGLLFCLFVAMCVAPVMAVRSAVGVSRPGVVVIPMTALGAVLVLNVVLLRENDVLFPIVFLFMPFVVVLWLAMYTEAMNLWSRETRSSGAAALCVACGYDSTGLRTGVCPECGSRWGERDDTNSGRRSALWMK